MSITLTACFCGRFQGISETFSDRPSTSMHISQTEDQLDSVSEQLANVQVRSRSPLC